MNKYLYLFLAVILGGATVGVAINTLKKPNSLFQACLDKTARVHDEALERIKEEYNIPQERWDATMQAIADVRAKDDLFAPAQQPVHGLKQPWIVQKVYEVAQEYGMNPARLTVTCVDAKSVNLQAIQDFDENHSIIHLVEINPTWCDQYSKEMQEAFVRHELMHIYNYDPIEDGYITYLLDTLGHKPEDSAKNPALINFRHARELRADLLAGCNSMSAAHALQEHYTHDIPDDNKRSLAAQISHPTATDRVAQLTQLIAQMDQQPTMA